MRGSARAARAPRRRVGVPVGAVPPSRLVAGDRRPAAGPAWLRSWGAMANRRRKPSVASPQAERTLVRLGVSGPMLIGLRRSLPGKALGRLHALVQTAADL